ncbi:MAG: lipoprotein signal peptidase [Rhodocyclales bacterium]|nr:lipoprotein signal peptidase [Rhodocyclales bacterium]
MSLFTRLRPTLAIALAVMALDQGSKLALSRWIPEGERLVLAPFLQLVSVYNTGAAFSFLAQAGGWQRGLFLALAFGMSVWLLWLAASPQAGRLERLAYGLIVGGALGNAIDRLAHGAVYDFLLFHAGRWAWPAFNLADSAITVGVGLLLWHHWRAPSTAANGPPPERST